MEVKETARSLSARLTALLTIALLPLGLIAVFQTYKVVSEAESVSRSDMLARTTDIARAQVELIIEAQGAANGIGAAVVEVGPDSPACDAVMQNFIKRNREYVFAGFIDAQGQMRCGSTGEPTDFSSYATWTTFVADPKPTVVINRHGTATGASVLIVSTPVLNTDGSLFGASSVSIPHSLLDALVAKNIEGVDVAITDGQGAVVSESGEALGARLSGTDGFFPAELLIGNAGRVIELDDYSAISVVPIRPFDLFVVGAWSNGSNPLSVSTFGTAAPLFPIAMWLASLFVAIFAIQGLVLKHLKQLRLGMRHVSLENLDDSFVKLEGAPREIGEIGESYNALLSRVAHDATALAEAAEDKELLLKEVHHRVKNNLQLIASILNMQLRQITSPDARSVLRRVQQRVMSLAAIHKLLYTDTKIDLVRADHLLSEIVSNTASLGRSDGGKLNTRISLDPLELDPDRAVPLALLVTEAVTNAMKYAGTGDGASEKIDVSLSDEGENRVELRVRNSLGDAVAGSDSEDGTGLGSKLISAFVTQLDGESQVDRGDGTYELLVRFPKVVGQEKLSEAA